MHGVIYGHPTLQMARHQVPALMATPEALQGA